MHHRSHDQGRGSLSGRSLSRGSLSRGVSGDLSRGSLSSWVSVQEVLVWGSLTRGVSVQGGLCPGWSLPGGLCLGRFLSREGSLLGASV